MLSQENQKVTSTKRIINRGDKSNTAPVSGSELSNRIITTVTVSPNGTKRTIVRDAEFYEQHPELKKKLQEMTVLEKKPVVRTLKTTQPVVRTLKTSEVKACTEANKHTEQENKVEASCSKDTNVQSSKKQKEPDYTHYLTIPTTPLEIFEKVMDNKNYIDSWYKMFNKDRLSEVNLPENEREHLKLLNSMHITAEECKNIMGNQWRHNLAIIGGFIEHYQYTTTEERLLTYPISTTSDFMKALCGNHRNASNLIKHMKDLHLLTEAEQTIDVEKLTYDEQGKVASRYISKKKVSYSYLRHICKEYYYSKSIQRDIKDIIEKEQVCIKQVKINNECSDVISNNIDVRSIRKDLFDKVLFSFHLMIPCTEKNMDSIIREILYKKYPLLREYQKMADEMNKNLDSASQIKFAININYSRSGKNITKIGIRATNSMVSAKDEEKYNKQRDRLLKQAQEKSWKGQQALIKLNNMGKNFKGKWKEDVLENYFGKGVPVYHFDVKSSVPRVTFLMNHGVWLDNSIDLYELIFKKFCEITHIKEKEFTGEVRLIFKGMFMRGYFDSPKKLVTHIMPALLEGFNGYNISCGEIEFSHIVAMIKENAEKYCNAYVQAINNVLGEHSGSEIFMHESCIYLAVVKELRERGYKVWQQYDGFYSDCKDIEEIEGLVEEKAQEYYRKYKETEADVEEETEEVQKQEDKKEQVQECKSMTVSSNNIGGNLGSGTETETVSSEKEFISSSYIDGDGLFKPKIPVTYLDDVEEAYA